MSNRGNPRRAEQSMDELDNAEAARRERRRITRLTVAVVVLGVLAGAAAALVWGHGHRANPVLAVVLIVGFVLVFIVAVLVIVRYSRRRLGRSPLWELEPPDRKQVLRAIRTGDPVEPQLRPYVYRTARYVLAGPRLTWWWLGILVPLQVVGFVVQPGPSRYFNIAVGVCLVLLAVSAERLRRQARHAVAEYAAEAQPGPAAG